ncbi:uncharacterized protein LOC113232254 [Hyposmocoma kahamanoa]|uniref:uncharacterized protein LOC113232254 n=1 Tax=Hyposmocoma kahamanoa TaxID=1477025 RepID=UPI000E6D6EAC|nr:uncharacterized protein LOC113232254 [Hyposmocoma kahamanoa]
MVYTRPSTMPIPTIWHRFTVRKGGVLIPLRVQDLTVDLEDRALQLLEKYFTRDEPPCKCIGIQNHPTALSELSKLWRTTIQDKLSLVCVEDKDNPAELIGVNALTVASRSDKDEIFQSDDKVWAQVFGAVDTMARSVDIFQHFGVDQYLTAYGLVVDPEWRGLNIGKEILIARIPLCKALGLKVTATVFTAGASQAAAKKAGFETLSEITYDELAKRGYVFPGVQEDTKSSKLMALKIG